MAKIDIKNLEQNSLIMQWNVDSYGNPASVRIENEIQQISLTHNLIQLAQIPDNYYKVKVSTEKQDLIEVFKERDVKENTFFVDYGTGTVHFDKSLAGQYVVANYYGRGIVYMSDTRIFHKTKDSFAYTLDDLIEKSSDAIAFIDRAGSVEQAIKDLENKAEEGQMVVDRIEELIEDTQFYGYTIVLSREAFVVKADEDGYVKQEEINSVYADVVAYKGAVQFTPTIKIGNKTTDGCEFVVEDGQRIQMTKISSDVTKAQTSVIIDCGDGLVAERVLEVTKVFDAVNPYQVEITNTFFNFNADSEGKIRETQETICEFSVTKAGEYYRGYKVFIHNMPNGLLHNLPEDNMDVESITFTATTGASLPENGTVIIQFQLDSKTVINKSFVFSKSKQGLTAQFLSLTGNQLIKYDSPNYSGIPTPQRSVITALTSGISGTPIWSVLKDNEWHIVNTNSTYLSFDHDDQTIWGDNLEITIRCEMDGLSDEISLFKLANGSEGYSIMLSNESSIVQTDLDGRVPQSEIEKQKTSVIIFRGDKELTPSLVYVAESGLYQVSTSNSQVQLLSIDDSEETVTIPITIEVEGHTFEKQWTIAKAQRGVAGAPASTYVITVEGGTRAITYNALNENPRPIESASFNAKVYKDGEDVTGHVTSWYWQGFGHVSGVSIENVFKPIIANKFDGSILNNSVSVEAIIDGNILSYVAPISITKDAGGIDWVADWDSRKVSIRDTEILTPKIFAGTYDASTDSVTGVGMGVDLLGDDVTTGIVAYQDDHLTFLLDTDGSLMIGNPYDDDGIGIIYDNGELSIKVKDLSIAGDTVPTWGEMEDSISQANNAIMNILQSNMDNLNSELDDITSYVDTILQDNVVSEVEKARLDALFQAVVQEVNSVQGLYGSVINNQYFTDPIEVDKLVTLYDKYMMAYDNIVAVYNNVFNDEMVKEIEETLPEEEYLESEDFSLEEVAIIDEFENLAEEDEEQEDNEPIYLPLGDEEYLFGEGMEALSISYNTKEINEVSLDTLTTLDGYILVTFDGAPITIVTEDTLIDFEDAVNVLREYAINLHQAINDALLYISKNQAEVLVDIAKEEVRAEISDVNVALDNLETTMNGDFKTGLIGSQNRAILEDRLRQLEIEKCDIDGQYEVLYANASLDAKDKRKLGTAKANLDTAHDVLVAKINQVISDNLMTEKEIESVNVLISDYASYLQTYSGVAQECNATIALNSVNSAMENLTDEEIFNRVTNYGIVQGLFFKDDKVYINSEYINTRNFIAKTDDGLETFKIDENGEVSITAKSLSITGSSNLATQDYVNTQIENITNTNVMFTLSNEFQIIPTDESYYPLSEGTYVINIKGYLGSSEEITDFTIGKVESGDGIIAVVSNVNKTIIFTVSSNTPMMDSNGYIDIPITYGNRQYNKRWSWAVSKQGNQATYVTITGEQFFKYTNNYTGTPTPSKIQVVANVFNSTETGKWQYDNNGTWVDCDVTDKILTLYPTQYTLQSLKRVTLRYYVDSVFDTFTVACISDGANGTNGKGVSSVVNKYLATTLATGVTVSTSGWTTTVQQIDSTKKYLWNYEIITYTDNSTTETLPCVIGRYGADGQDGQNGENGRGVKTIIEYYLTSNYTSPQDVLLGDWSTSTKVPTKDAKYLWNYSEIEYTDGVKEAQSPRIIGNYAEDGQDGQDGASGSDAYTVLLTNENETFLANNLGATHEQIVYTSVIAYKGVTPITPIIGVLPTVEGMTIVKTDNRIGIRVEYGTSLADKGSFDIPITVDGHSFTKTFSWTKVKDGSDGIAKNISLSTTSQVFKSTDGGNVFTPNTITVTATFQNLEIGVWMVSNDGGYNWETLSSYSGLTTSENSVIVSKDCSAFTDESTSIVLMVTDVNVEYYDMITITKLYDVADVDFEGMAEEVAKEQIDDFDKRLNQQAVFNRLTDNGKLQGLYMEDDELYVNGEYINTKNFKAVNNQGNQTFLIDSSGNVHINANTFSVSGNSVPTTEDVMNMIDSYGQSENLLLTPNFNSGSLSPNWSWSVGSFVYIDTTYKHDGSTACRLKSSNAGSIYLSTKHMSTDVLKNGQTYLLTMWVYCTDTSGVGTYTLDLYGTVPGETSMTMVGQTTFSGNNLIANQWTQIKCEATPTQGYTTPTIAINGVNGAIDAWVTDFELKEKGDSLSQQQLVSILNGAGQGLYIVDGQVLINAEYIQTGTLRADLISVQTDEQTSNLLPFNYVTLTNAINTDSFGIMSQNTANVYLTIDLPIPYGGTDVDTLTTPIGYSKVTLKKGRSYWFVCEYLARWTSDKKYENGVGVSTATTGSKYGIGTGNNMDILLYPSLDRQGFNEGRNLLNRTDGRGVPAAFLGEYVNSGFNISTNSTYGYFTLSSGNDSSTEHYLRFMAPNPTNRYGFDSDATYTFSGYVRGTKKEISIRWEGSTDGVNWDVGDVHLLGIVSDTRDVYFEYTFTIPSQVRGFYISFQSYNDKTPGTTAVFSKLKLEKSTKATPWCLSPSDQGYTNPATIEESKPSYTLASVYDFNASVKVDANAIYGRNWTTLISRIDCTHDFTGYLWLNLDGSGFPAQDSGYALIRHMQLTYAEDSEAPIVLDYLKQINEKQFILTDGAYFTNTIGIDGIRMQEGNIIMTSESANRSININYDSIELKHPQSNEYQYLAIGNSTFEYLASGAGGNSVIIEDKSYGFVASARNPSTKLIDGIFTGIHYGYNFIDKNGATVYGRPDIYRHTNKWDEWELLGAKVEPLGLVRRDSSCNISTNGLFITGDATNTDFSQGGITYHGSVMFSEPLYTTTGNGQIINVHKNNQRIYFGNPNSQVLIESGNVLQATYNNVTYNLGALLASSASIVSLDDDGEDVQQPEIITIVAQLQARVEELEVENQELEERLARIEAMLLNQ